MLRLLIVGGLLVVTGQLPTGSPGDPTTTTTVEPEPATTTVNYSRNHEKYLPRIGPKNKALGVREPAPADGAPRTNEEFLKKFGVPGPKEGADDPKNAVYGVFGKNYYTWNGRPYINCAVSVSVERPLDDEVDEFGNKTEKRNTETQRCFLDLGRSYDQLSCMTVFMYKGSEETLKNETKPRKKIVIQSQGCWTNQAHAIETCTKGPACIHAGIIHGGRQMFCCCKEHNCNDHLELDPGAETNPKYFDIARWQHDNMEGVIKHEELKQVDPNKRPEPPGIWLEFVVFFVSVIFMGVLAACVYGINELRKKKNKQDGGQADEALLPNELEPQKKIWEIVTNSMHEIGQGKYGMVYKAEYRPSPDAALKTVAVKVFKGNNQSFQNELTIYNDNCMKKCMKGSILRLLDYDIAAQTLITEYHEMGNLHHFLKNRTIDQPLDCLSLIVSLLEALTFLHEERGPVHGDPKPVILHRDIKSHNVLLRMDSRNRLVGVVMDFGLSMRCSQVFDGEMNIKNMMHKVVGTQRYMAPELLVGAAELDITHFKAIDVYALALVIWEILSRTKVFPSDEVSAYIEPLESDLRKEQPGDPIRLSTYRLVVVAQKKRPEFRKAILDDKILTKVTNSLEEMWEHDAGCRVSAACVLRRMEVLFDEGYHSGTMEGGQSNCSMKSQESDLEKTPPPSRTFSPEDEATDNTIVVNQVDETNSPSILTEATKLLTKSEKLGNGPEEIELQEVR